MKLFTTLLDYSRLPAWAGAWVLIAACLLSDVGRVWADNSSDALPRLSRAQSTNAPPQWLQIHDRTLLAGGKAVQLRGIGLGNWMLVEGFMLGLPQVDYVIRQTFNDVLGPQKAAAFWNAYMDNYITETDIARIRAMGFNHVRLPFSYRQFESDAHPGRWREEGFQRLDRVIGWCRQQGLWVMLDLHSAPGCQAADWNAESAHGEIYLWDNANDQQRVAALWREIARRYRKEPTVMAYELLNEPDTSSPRQVASLNAFHLQCIRAIRKVDQRHIIVVDGDKHATDLRALDAATFADPQVMAAFHFYHQYTPPLREIASFPGTNNGQVIDTRFLVQRTGLATRSDRQRIPRPEFLDEFGSGYGGPNVGAQRKMLESIIGWCEDQNVHWCLWHWKDVRGMGLWHMREGTPWLQLLERLGASRLRTDSDAAVKTYLTQVDGFLSLDRQSRLWLDHETHRDLQMQTLRILVEGMKDLSADELAALGRSFNSDNFEADAPMAAALQRLMKSNAAPATAGPYTSTSGFSLFAVE